MKQTGLIETDDPVFRAGNRLPLQNHIIGNLLNAFGFPGKGLLVHQPDDHPVLFDHGGHKLLAVIFPEDFHRLGAVDGLPVPLIADKVDPGSGIGHHLGGEKTDAAGIEFYALFLALICLTVEMSPVIEGKIHHPVFRGPVRHEGVPPQSFPGVPERCKGNPLFPERNCWEILADIFLTFQHRLLRPPFARSCLIAAGFFLQDLLV
jgi:hypothetical protein